MTTIFAVSSGRPPAAIAILRISGPASLSAAVRLAGTLPPPRRTAVRALRHEGIMLDRALVLVMPGPDSATGEDVVELHLHGGRAVVDAVERALAAMPDCRRAEPGEFTRRALANARIDLAEAEGLADLLTAETEAQRRAAMDNAEGRLSRTVRRWLGVLSACAAALEVQIDYDEDGDSAIALADGGTQGMLAALAEDMRLVLSSPPVERLRDGIRIVVAGPPNTGKSSLVNAMAAREVAIVSPIAGTTRDRIEAFVERAGQTYSLMDTAGITVSGDPIETIGVALAQRTLEAADLVLWTGPDVRPGALNLHTLADLPERSATPQDRWAVSSFSDASVLSLWAEVERRTTDLFGTADLLSLNRRQQAATAAALVSLDAVSEVADPIIIAEHVRQAASALASVVGMNATEAMLDALFSRFCVGK